MQNLLTAQEVAKTLKISKPYVYKLAGSGALRSVQWPTIGEKGVKRNMVRFYEKDVLEFIEDSYSG
jgi:excisionase family DNA binding protein